ncbi:hypothetical protein HEK616_01270 [Streptomyces nigrescens]|uniref:Uncharacterized protein n=1 Tax=Streptomyces nigrescens TaxID=1920 RepID=A0ABM7ZJU8_STRNI|nr:hypothetical protein HEK616_01270 [Streptomyces nigrescens]
MAVTLAGPAGTGPAAPEAGKEQPAYGPACSGPRRPRTAGPEGVCAAGAAGRAQAAELVLDALPEDDVVAVDGLLSELLDEEPAESEDVVFDEEELFAGLLLDDEPRLSLR